MTKQEILDYLDNVLHPIVSPDNWNVYSELYDMIEELPSAEPERKKGKYLKTGDPKWIECSECGMHTRYLKKYNVPNFCPACGADMRGEKDG